MQTRKLGTEGPVVSEIGLGCMGMSEFYGPRDDAQSMATLLHAVDLGITFFDTADMYGHGHNETLVGAFARDCREELTIATKFGIVRDTPGVYARDIDNSPDYIRAACDRSLKRLGVERIDLYYAHRVDKTQPIEETVGVMAGLIQEGKVGALGLCEVSSATLRRAHAAYPIAAVQSEYSLWTRDPEEDVLGTCRELGIGFVAYSPLGRGFLTGAMAGTSDLAEDDYRRTNPRFQQANFEVNLTRMSAVEALARDKGCTPAQLVLAWLLAQGDDIVPIPGTKRSRYLSENVGAADITVSADELAQLSAAMPAGEILGDRYTEEGMKGLNA